MYPLTSLYYGVFDDDVSDLRKEFTSRKKFLKNKLCGKGQNIRFLTVQKMSLQIKVMGHIELKSITRPVFYV